MFIPIVLRLYSCVRMLHGIRAYVETLCRFRFLFLAFPLSVCRFDSNFKDPSFSTSYNDSRRSQKKVSHFLIIKNSIEKKDSLIHAFCDNYFYTITNIKELSETSLKLQTAQRIRHCK